MQQTIEIKRGSERAVLPRVESIVKSCREWLNEKSETGSLIMSETVTRLQVVLTQVILIMIIGATVAVNFSLSLALLFLACASWAVYQLNILEKGGQS
ncbi:MAG: hypothetical protein J6C05_08995 [Prevotella sp.]|nr:hypothetical protein [Prevotella sp.]MBO5157245.1 hypothetical protein [Prevotella sp.]